MYIERQISGKILELTKYFPVVCITGPRQSGKTTLIRVLFPKLPYVSFEDPDNRLNFTEDPKGFLSPFQENGAVFDEVQQIPSIFSYIQSLVDDKLFKGTFILSGSQNFLLLQSITQTLAGRIGIANVFPFSNMELHLRMEANWEKQAFRGFYPRIFDKNIPHHIFYPPYIQTYIERDILNIKSITDKTVFLRFIKLCAGRTGQLLNYTQLANDCGISVNTAKAWLSLLESSFIIFLLPPFYKNINKQLSKSPKLYFYDTGLLTYLLDIKSADQMTYHYLKGSIFENFVIAEIMKQLNNNYSTFSSFFIRDKTGNEVDLNITIDKSAYVEIKSSKTWQKEYGKSILYFNNLIEANKLFGIYDGSQEIVQNKIEIKSWKNIDSLLKSITS